MEFPLEFQKICQVDTRKLLFFMALVASTVLIIQFLSIPYGSVFLSLFPTGKVLLVGKSDHSGLNSFPISEVIVGIFPLNTSFPSDPSGSSAVVTNTDGSDLEETTEHANKAKRKKGGPEYNSGLDGVIELENEFLPKESMDPNNASRSENVEVSHDESILEKDREPGNDSPSVQILLDNAQTQNKSLTIESVQSGNSTSISVAPALQPAASSADLASPRKNGANISTFVIYVKPNAYSVGDHSENMLSKDKKPDMVGTGQAISESSSTVTTNSIQKGKLEMPPRPISVAEMNLLLLESHASSRATIPRWSSVRDQEILSAKSQIVNSPMLKKDQQLYAPLYHNVSMFKRSYELMEKMLKVYIYKEGEQPIFHRPETKGIYASEGWFMKQMEGNRQFSVKDPTKAHLFYLPFSTRRLEQFLYVPNSHSSKNMVQYLKKYLDLISSKYPFWNRTGGADHFLVGCHDWAPAETRQHMQSCIRALCNADISIDFTMGKDASLPETNVRLAKDPVRDLGGKPPSKREILAFFAGSMHGYLRPILLQHWENKDPDMQIYGHMGRSGKNKGTYVQRMKNSKYCICAKGYEVNSPRVVEAIFYECVPVIISDNFVPPFFEVLNWESFAVFVAEKDIPNLKNILLSIPEEKYLSLQLRVRKVQQHFLWHTKPVKYDIFHMILHSVWYNRVFQIKTA